MLPVVVFDASYVLSVVMGDEPTPASSAQVMAARLLAPPVWPLEVANILNVNRRRGRLDAAQVTRVCEVIDALDVQVVSPAETGIGHWCRLADTHGLTTYDAQYLDLAMQQRCGIATCDQRLTQAALRVGLPVYT